MTVTDVATAHPDVLQDTWVLLDEASQLLLRAEAIVVLLGLDCDASRSQAYAADVGVELLGRLKGKLAAAQQLLRPTSIRRSRGSAHRK